MSLTEIKQLWVKSASYVADVDCHYILVERGGGFAESSYQVCLPDAEQLIRLLTAALARHQAVSPAIIAAIEDS